MVGIVVIIHWGYDYCDCRSDVDMGNKPSLYVPSPATANLS